jgi:hypothetical protein
VKFIPNGLLSLKGQETSLLNVQKGSEAKPYSYSMGTEGVFREDKAAGREADYYSPSSTAEFKT